MKLSHIEWELLDSLLGRMGFGGYYDMVECLRDIGHRMSPKLQGSEEWSKESDIHTMITLLMKLEIEK